MNFCMVSNWQQNQFNWNSSSTQLKSSLEAISLVLGFLFHEVNYWLT